LIKPILSPRNLPILGKFAGKDVLLAFDFDGTLAPLVTEPDRAVLRPRTRKLLGILAARSPCIVVSGRSRADLRRRLSGIALKEVIGNHGIEPWNSSRAIAGVVQSWVPMLQKRLAPFAGVVFENKRFSVSIHYRKERHKAEVREAIAEIAKNMPGARLVSGKQVVNILPQGTPDKGFSVERERKRSRLEKAIYVGDDETDESVFALAKGGRYLTILVGTKKSSLARYYIGRQRDIDRLLQCLVWIRDGHLCPASRPSIYSS
jgi:trehalose 6-phosphate phosphatase